MTNKIKLSICILDNSGRKYWTECPETAYIRFIRLIRANLKNVEIDYDVVEYYYGGRLVKPLAQFDLAIIIQSSSEYSFKLGLDLGKILGKEIPVIYIGDDNNFEEYEKFITYDFADFTKEFNDDCYDHCDCSVSVDGLPDLNIHHTEQLDEKTKLCCKPQKSTHKLVCRAVDCLYDLAIKKTIIEQNNY